MSLYGADPKYCIGAIKNARLLEKIYPGWQLWIYHDQNVPRSTLKDLKNLGVILKITYGASMFHRFLVNEDPYVERYLIRDADSRFCERERNVVDEWIESDLGFCVIRDHGGHFTPIPGGLWGGKTGILKMRQLMDGINLQSRSYNADQIFLREKIWPLIKDDCYQRDLVSWRSFPGAKSFPAYFNDLRFCGEVFSAEDQPRDYDWETRLNYCQAKT